MVLGHFLESKAHSRQHYSIKIREIVLLQLPIPLVFCLLVCASPHNERPIQLNSPGLSLLVGASSSGFRLLVGFRSSGHFVVGVFDPPPRLPSSLKPPRRL